MHAPKRILALLAVGLLGGSMAAQAALVGPVTNPGNGSVYYVIDGSTTWAQAEAQAASLGGHLVTINDLAENQWILSNLAGPGNLYWTGARDDAVEGTFAWTSGETWSYANWAPGEPDNDTGSGGNGDFGYFDGTTGLWGDTDGSFAGFVGMGIAEVMQETTPVPLPAAAWLLLSGLGGLGFVGRRRKAA